MRDINDLEAHYEWLLKEKSDINEHLPTLRSLAEECGLVVEFGTCLGRSTVALGLGANEGVDSWDLKPTRAAEESARASGNKIRLHVGDTRKARFDVCDMLFLDSLHTEKQVREELAAHGHKAQRFIAFHDTVSYGEVGEDGGAGILGAIHEFMEGHPEWQERKHYKNNNGLLILERVSE